jgi:UDP-N-acetylglucosamine--N-acetylmuramyl-(pentapeptide) pyrophosphoryl-undecaprenol N-acetylglucosamine transferase
MKVVISAGGTGGHITPALAIAEEIRKRGGQVLYIGNKDSMEERIVTKAGFHFYPINVQKLYRKITIKHFLFPFRFVSSLFKSIVYIQRFKPDFFIGCGGFVSGAPGFAAKAGNIPIFLHEQNSFPGLTTRMLSNHAIKIFLGIEDGKKYIKNNRTYFTGNPIREFRSGKIDFENYGLNPDFPTLFITGGSQGSQFINGRVIESLDFLNEMDLNVIWQAGKNNVEEVKSKIGDIRNFHVFGFSSEIDKFYGCADFVLSRSGALSLAELEEFKLPGIIIPLPTSAGNHQLHNAENFCRNYGILLEQKNITKSTFCDSIKRIMQEHKEMKAKFGVSKHRNAAKVIVDEITKIIGKG